MPLYYIVLNVFCKIVFTKLKFLLQINFTVIVRVPRENTEKKFIEEVKKDVITQKIKK